MPEPARRLNPRPPLRAIGVVGGDDERGDLTLSPPAPAPPAPRRPRPLRLSERRLAAWLHAHLSTVGAVAMVRRFGARQVLDALYDGVVCEEPAYESRPVVVGTWPDGSERTTQRLFEFGRRRIPSPGLRNPGGFLRFLLEEGAGR